MKRLSIIIGILFLSMAVQAQKQKVEVTKDKKILVDGVEIATIEKDGCGFTVNCDFYIRNLEGKTLITVMRLDYYDPSTISNTNKDGKVYYFRFSFADEKGVAELNCPWPSSKNVAKMVVRAKLIKDNELDDYQVRQFIQANGTRFSDRQDRQQTIIIR